MEDVAVEDVAVEDVAVEDVDVEDAAVSPSNRACFTSCTIFLAFMPKSFLSEIYSIFASKFGLKHKGSLASQGVSMFSHCNMQRLKPAATFSWMFGEVGVTYLKHPQ